LNLASDRRVRELIGLGEAVVPALIDAMEEDERLTRSFHSWRDFARSRTVLSVREAVLTAYRERVLKGLARKAAQLGYGLRPGQSTKRRDEQEYRHDEGETNQQG
jgi:hypothetical protein